MTDARRASSESVPIQPRREASTLLPGWHPRILPEVESIHHRR